MIRLPGIENKVGNLRNKMVVNRFLHLLSSILLYLNIEMP